MTALQLDFEDCVTKATGFPSPVLGKRPDFCPRRYTTFMSRRIFSFGTSKHQGIEPFLNIVWFDVRSEAVTPAREKVVVQYVGGNRLRCDAEFFESLFCDSSQPTR